MSKYLVIIIYLIFISLGLPDSLLGSGWPVMQKEFDVDSSYAGYISMTITGVTIISALFSSQITNLLTEKWVMIISIALTVIGLILYSIATKYWHFFPYAIPYGLGAGSIDATLGNFVAIHYSSRVLNFLHCFYGVGSMISPNVMALALKYKSWRKGYRWTGYIQIGILVICFATIPLWKMDKDDKNDKNKDENTKKEEEDNKDNDSKKEIEESKNRIIKIKVSKLDNNEDNNKDKEIETKEAFSKKLTIEEKEKEKDKNKETEEKVKVLSIIEALKIKGVIISCLSFFTYCSGEATCFLWTSSFFDGTKEGLSKEAISSLSTTIFGGLMFGRFISGFISEKLGEKKLIRMGLIIEFIGIICVGIPIKTYVLAVIGYCLVSIGMGPIFPSTQHLTPLYFGKEASSTITGLQLAFSYAASTFMPFIFGLIQSKTSMWAHPIYVGIFAILNFIFVEIVFRLGDKNNVENKNDNTEIKVRNDKENKNYKDNKENNIEEIK